MAFFYGRKMAKKTEKLELSEDEKIIKEAKERWAYTEEKLNDERKLMLEDLKFSIGDSDNLYQWDSSHVNIRRTEGRPFITKNKLPQFINQVINDARANRPQIKCRPIGGGADVEDAEVFAGLIRNIERSSRADIAYDTAVEYAARCGVGYARVITDYVDDLSFDQDIIIKAVNDPLSVRLDPDYVEPDGSDVKWAFVETKETRSEFEKKYPDKDLSSWDNGDGWVTDDSIRIVEYFRLKEINTKILLLSDGSTVYEGEEYSPELTVTKSRNGKKTTCEWFKLNCHEVLEKTEILCSFVPVVPCIGNQVWIEGKPYRSGMVRNSKDAQKEYNFLASSEIEHLMISPKAPYVGYKGQFTDPKWDTANVTNHAYLEADPLDVNGDRAPLPQRQPFAGVPVGIVNAMNIANQDIRETIGMYQASVGAPSTETSGKAILAKQQEGDTGTFHYRDNQARMVMQIARIVMSMIPNYYDTQRVSRIIGEDDTAEMVDINPDQGMALDKIEDGKEIKRIFNPNKGKYDVAVVVGASYATKRVENAQSMIELAGVIPAVANVGADIIARQMDFEGADELADRLKASLPPEITSKGEDGEQNIPPELQQTIQQIQMIQQAVDQKAQELAQREQEVQAQEGALAGEQAKLTAQRQVMDANARALKAEISQELMKLSYENQNETQQLKTYVNQLEGLLTQYMSALEPETEEEPQNGV